MRVRHDGGMPSPAYGMAATLARAPASYGTDSPVFFFFFGESALTWINGGTKQAEATPGGHLQRKAAKNHRGQGGTNPAAPGTNVTGPTPHRAWPPRPAPGTLATPSHPQGQASPACTPGPYQQNKGPHPQGKHTQAPRHTPPTPPRRRQSQLATSTSQQRRPRGRVTPSGSTLSSRLRMREVISSIPRRVGL